MEKIFTKIEKPHKNTEFDTVLMRTCLLTCHLPHLAHRPRARRLEDHISEQMCDWGPAWPRAWDSTSFQPVEPAVFPTRRWRDRALYLPPPPCSSLHPKPGTLVKQNSNTLVQSWCKMVPFQFQRGTHSGHAKVSPGYFWLATLATVSALNVWYLNEEVLVEVIPGESGEGWRREQLMLPPQEKYACLIPTKQIIKLLKINLPLFNWTFKATRRIEMN